MILSQLVLNHLVFNENYMRKAIPHLKADFFPTIGEAHIFGLIDEFVAEFGVSPTPEALAVKLERSNLAEGIYNEAMSCVAELEPSLDNTEWMLKESEAWARDRGLANAVRKAARVYAGEDKLTPDQLPDLFTEALNIRFEEDLGHFYWEASAKHYDLQHSEQVKIKFGIDILNHITRGGIEPKTLNIILAGINVGKTSWLIDRAADYLEQGKNVIYFTCEVEERKIRHRSDVRLLNTTFDRLEAMTKPEYLAYIDKKKRKTDGEFVIKEFPSGVATTNHFRHHIKEIEARRGIKFDVIIVDYLTEMSSSRLPAHMMGNTNTYYGSVARELRALAIEFGVPLWTAMQLTRDKQDGLNAKVSDTADAITIPKIADFMMSIGMEEADALLKQAYVTQMKNRYADKFKLPHFRIGLDNDKQMFFDLGYDQQQGVMSDEQISGLKKNQIIPGPDKETLKKEDSVASWNFAE